MIKIVVFIVFLILLMVCLLAYFFLSANNGIINDNGLKEQYLSLFPKKYTVGHQVVTPDRWQQVVNRLKYPVILKPDDCSGKGKNVEMVKSVEEAEKYIKGYNGCYKKIVAQDFCRLAKEFSVLYERYPISSKGSAIAIVEKIPFSKTDKFTPLNIREPDGTRRTKIVDHTDRITKEFSDLIDQITKRIPDLYVGRYDVKAASIDQLLKGNFKILELNNLFGGDTRCYVDTINLFDRYNYKIQLRWIIKRILCGIQNNSIRNPLAIIKNMIDQTYVLCDSDYEEIFAALKKFMI